MRNAILPLILACLFVPHVKSIDRFAVRIGKQAKTDRILLCELT